MPRKLYISDMHLGHRSVIGYDGRPFADCAEMKQAFIANWNAAVTRADEVYILGDYARDPAIGLEVIRQLKGKKYLIIGNHDKTNEELEKEFEWCGHYEEVFDQDTSNQTLRVVLCHYPIAHWHGADKGSVHLYGHLHQSRDSQPFEEYVKLMRQRELPYRCYNVGCMMPYMAYTPRTLKEILAACGDSVY